MKLKKGALGIDSLGGMAVTFVVTAIVIGFGAMVLSELSEDLTGTAEASVDNGTEALAKFGQWLPTLAIIVVAAIIISVVVGAFYIGGRR